MQSHSYRRPNAWVRVATNAEPRESLSRLASTCDEPRAVFEPAAEAGRRRVLRNTRSACCSDQKVHGKVHKERRNDFVCSWSTHGMRSSKRRNGSHIARTSRLSFSKQATRTLHQAEVVQAPVPWLSTHGAKGEPEQSCTLAGELACTWRSWQSLACRMEGAQKPEAAVARTHAAARTAPTLVRPEPV
eukprot:6192386-Pleurochrysis_carterae.AAC.2